MEGYKSKIGKDQMRQYMGGLYENSMVIFREYLQNACDAVEQALEEGLIPNRRHANIAVKIDQYNKRIIIEDVGIGISTKNIGPYLVDVASSQKFNKQLVGRHGIGRLNGANYCDRIIYETSSYGESVKSTLVWNVKKARELCDSDIDIDTPTIIDEVTDQLPQVPEVPEKHYCIVTLENVNDPHLMDEDAVREYISEIVSVDYDLEFRENVLDPALGLPINEGYKERFENLWIYAVTVNEIPVEKTYRSEFKDKKLGTMQCFTLIDEKTQQELAWGWFALTNTAEQLNDAPFSFIRGRHHNFQIGGGDLLNKYHKSTTAPAYSVGELHITHPRINPTATRDGIEGGPERRKLETALRKFFEKIYRQYNMASKFRSEVVAKFATLDVEIARAKLTLKGESDAEAKSKLKEAIKKKQDERKTAQTYLPKYQQYFEENNLWTVGEDVIEAVNESIIEPYNGRSNVQLADAQIPSLKVSSFKPELPKPQSPEPDPTPQDKPDDFHNTPNGGEENPSNTDTPGGENTDTPSVPSEIDKYKGQPTVVRNLVRKFLAVIDSMTELPDKQKDKMKTRLRKKILK